MTNDCISRVSTDQSLLASYEEAQEIKESNRQKSCKCVLVIACISFILGVSGMMGVMGVLYYSNYTTGGEGGNMKPYVTSQCVIDPTQEGSVDLYEKQLKCQEEEAKNSYIKGCGLRSILVDKDTELGNDELRDLYCYPRNVTVNRCVGLCNNGITCSPPPGQMEDKWVLFKCKHQNGTLTHEMRPIQQHLSCDCPD